jgi:GNAT superfamily N-acetyltransferase
VQFVDRNLAHRLELTDAHGGVAFARAHAELFPESGATAAPFAGGWASFAGVDSPITQAFALGLGGAVEEDEIARMEEFFRSRGAATNVELCPYADLSIIEIFRKRGYTLIEFSNVFARPLTAADAQLSFDGAARVRRPEPHEARLWAETVARGFMPEGELPQMLIDVMTTSLHSAAGAYFLAELDGQVAGGGVLVMHEGVASLGGASTLPAFRNRGVQTALLCARLAYAAQQGCELVMVTTLPGSASQRNVERQGFRVVYTRSKLQLPVVVD